MQHKKAKALLLLGGIVSIFTVAMVLGAWRQDSGPATPATSSGQDVHDVYYGVSWTEWYHDARSLKGHSDVVIVGTISKVIRVSQQRGFVATTFDVSVDRVVHDPHHMITGPAIPLFQTGGIVGNTRYSIDDDPLFRIGEQEVLFLHYDSHTGTFYVAGGPSGRFEVQQGIISPVTKDGVRVESSTPLNTFLDAVLGA